MKTIAECGDIFLPAGQMLLIDSIIEVTDHSIVCECNLDQHWVFAVHFPNDPIFPGSLLIEAAGQAVATWMWEQGMRGAPRLVRTQADFKSPVAPSTKTIALHASIRRRKQVCVATVDVIAANVAAARVTLTLTVLPVSLDTHATVQA